MSEIYHEIIPSTSKTFKTHYTFKIADFKQKLYEVSSMKIEVPGLTVCHLDVHPNQHRSSNTLTKFTKIAIRLDPPKYHSSKPRKVRFNIRTSVDICIWSDEFTYDYGSVSRFKEDFMKQIYLQSYMEKNDLILTGTLTIEEHDWDEANASILATVGASAKLVRDIHSLASSGTLSDFTFVVQGRELEVHKAILAARSPVFERMFTGSFRESKEDRQEIKDISADTFEEFLYFIYAGDLRNQEFPVDELLAVADRYQVSDLVSFCEAKILKNINSDNAESIYKMANSIQCNPAIKKTSFDILRAKFKSFSASIPEAFINNPEKVFKCLDMKKDLEQILTIEEPLPLEIESSSDEGSLENSAQSFRSGNLSVRPLRLSDIVIENDDSISMESSLDIGLTDESYYDYRSSTRVEPVADIEIN